MHSFLYFNATRRVIPKMFKSPLVIHARPAFYAFSNALKLAFQIKVFKLKINRSLESQVWVSNT